MTTKLENCKLMDDYIQTIRRLYEDVVNANIPEMPCPEWLASCALISNLTDDYNTWRELQFTKMRELRAPLPFIELTNAL